MQYIYLTGQNNGRVSQTIDGVLNETVNYTYDMWNRLITATVTNGEPCFSTEVDATADDEGDGWEPMPPNATPHQPKQGTSQSNPCPPVPVASDTANISQNIQAAQTVAALMSMNCNDRPSVGQATNLFVKLAWLYGQVRNKGPWDYKQRGSKYEKFGNFDFGAVGAALGIDLDTLLRGAGYAQQKAGTSNREARTFCGAFVP